MPGRFPTSARRLEGAGWLLGRKRKVRRIFGPEILPDAAQGFSGMGHQAFGRIGLLGREQLRGE